MTTIVLHGGAGVISKEIDGTPYLIALKNIINAAADFATSLPSPSALDIAEFTVTLLEDDPLFNAGRGAVFTADGTHELEASLMDGSTLRCGAVSLVKTVRHPISLARAVMERTSHNYLIGEEVLGNLADAAGLERVDPGFFSTEKRRDQLRAAKAAKKVFVDHDLDKPESGSAADDDAQDSSRSGSASTSVSGSASEVDNQSPPPPPDQPGGTGTVGCVVCHNGHVAAATSTGGMTNKMAGRVGDTPIIGAGTYANDKTAAISATGHGEEFMRHLAAFDVSSRINLLNIGVQGAVRTTVFEVLPEGSGGLIAVDTRGTPVMEFNCAGMFRAVLSADGRRSVGIWEELIEVDKIDL